MRKAFFCFNLSRIWRPAYITSGRLMVEVYERNPSKLKTKYTIAINRVKYYVGKYRLTGSVIRN